MFDKIKVQSVTILILYPRLWTDSKVQTPQIGHWTVRPPIYGQKVLRKSIPDGIMAEKKEVRSVNRHEQETFQ